MLTTDKSKRSTSSGVSTETTPDQKLKFKLYRKMIRRTFQDLCSSEKKIEEDASAYVETEKFAELVNLSGLKEGYTKAARELSLLSQIQRKAVMKTMLKEL